MYFFKEHLIYFMILPDILFILLLLITPIIEIVILIRGWIKICHKLNLVRISDLLSNLYIL
jgi:hypothetical protein